MILVHDNPYFSLSDRNGKCRIENVPPGKWRFTIWHERKELIREVQQNGESKILQHKMLEVEVKLDQVTDLGVIRFAP